MEKYCLTKQLVENIKPLREYDSGCYREPDKGYYNSKIQSAFAHFLNDFTNQFQSKKYRLLCDGSSGITLAAICHFLYPEKFFPFPIKHAHFSKMPTAPSILIDDYICSGKTIEKILNSCVLDELEEPFHIVVIDQQDKNRGLIEGIPVTCIHNLLNEYQHNKAISELSVPANKRNRGFVQTCVDGLLSKQSPSNRNEQKKDASYIETVGISL